jgi:hypothetical protein
LKSKLGFHIDIRTYPGQVEQMIRAKPTVIKVIENMGLLNDLHQRSPQTTLIARAWKVGDDFTRFVNSQGTTDPVILARHWFNFMLPLLQQAPFAYWESFNEMSNWSLMGAYGQFEAERQRILNNEGFQACIGNFAVGTPEIVGDGDLWPAFYPALEAAHRYGNILGLHEYGGLYMSTWYGPNTSDVIRSGNWDKYPRVYSDGWLFGRYRKVWTKHIMPHDWTGIKIALTEFGLDNVATADVDFLLRKLGLSGPVGSWTTCQKVWRTLEGADGSNGPLNYVKNLIWADNQLQKDPFVIGATVFTWGVSHDEALWKDFDIQGPAADYLVEHIALQQPDGPGWHTSSPTGQNVRSGPDYTYPILTVIYPHEVVDSYLDVNGWLHIATSKGIEGYVKREFMKWTD